ncbi:hypothetical protein V511_05880 [Mesotoga sp. Brook.08.YT.4.2.5.1]|nr:hypothetical protein V511_05880 [Mesotoga sp. Brook.08.YT.4.2.5.1]PVD17061.1 hypothetical protein V512_009040 [Mesotoga sp. Brook.08.105.5.1]RAM58505.1 hypothetical protein DS65_04190 [Mesotoga sp. SC_4PWL113PWK15]RAO96080.1 hypothetical protein M388_03210 [Mesotoga sp. Brook.08.YT.4.2.5.4.]RDI90705.1 hypothetical protein Q502_12860 [Mesotoga sp. Brook.08.YT.4.2.5.2.]
MKMGEKPVTFGGQSGFAWPVSRLARPVQLRGLRNAMKIRSPLTVQDHEPVHREGQSRKSIAETFAELTRRRELSPVSRPLSSSRSLDALL